jgi:hypothetical protein
MVTIAYFVWAALEIARMLLGRRKATAFGDFANMWRKYVH